jgi:signal transduction histidine kinase/CheY-like chemotaxis protein
VDVKIAPVARGSQVRAASLVGLFAVLLFSGFNLMTEGMQLLGQIELAAALLLVAPAVFLSGYPDRVRLAENLLLTSAVVIFGALVVLGGVQETGLYWVFTLPFLAFFLKGPRLGALVSVAFVALVSLYLFGLSKVFGVAHLYSDVVRLHFLLSLVFYTLVAATFSRVRSRFEAQLQQRQEQAESANQAKSRFLAAASHDLRQPAHALGMFVARLMQLSHEPQTQALVVGVDASVRALQDMLDTFFDYSRLDSPSLQLQVHPFAVQPIFDSLTAAFAQAAAAKGLRLRVRPSTRWLQSDPVLLQRVLLNLVGNAVQHSRQGSILVACRACGDGVHGRIEVWDSGVGIAPEHQDKVFEEFFQVGNDARDRSKGLGLGLSMVQRACRLLDHPLSMRSALGCGTRFGVRMPLAAAGLPATAGVEGDTAQKTELTGLQVLVIEDDALGSQALRGLLESWGCGVTVADREQTACDLVQDGVAPDFILSDYRLPGQHNGIDAIGAVRQLLGLEVAACVISGDTEVAVREQVRAAGLVLLQKPVRAAKLRSVMRHLVQAHERPNVPQHG